MLAPYGIGHFGVNYSVPAVGLTPGQLADASNIEVNEAGLITGRSGTLKLGAAVDYGNSPISGMFEYRNGSTVKTLCSYKKSLAYYNPATDMFIDFVSGLTEGKMTQWVNFAGKAICVNEGYDSPQYYDGSAGGALAGTPPKGKIICTWGSRVWLGGDSTNAALLTGCKLSDPTDWTTTGSSTSIVQQYVGDVKEPITGVFGYFDWLLIGKRNQLYKLSGEPPTDATKLSIYPVYDSSGDSVGFTSPWAITQVGNDLIFLDGMDIKRLSGIQSHGDVESVSIIPHFRDYLKSVANANYIQYTKFFHYKKKAQIWVSIPTSSVARYVFMIDYRHYTDDNGESKIAYSVFPMSFTYHITDFCGLRNGSVEDMYAGFSDGIVRKLDCGTDDDSATAIPRYFVHVVSGAGKTEAAYEYRKQFHQLRTCIKPTKSTLTMTPSYAVDLMDDAQIRSGTYTSLSAETVSSWAGTGVKRKDIRLFGVSGKTLALKWAHNAVAENFIMQPSTVDYEFKQKVEIV